jgi:hypothetical protein
VKLENVRPTDWDAANNSARDTVRVVEPAPAFDFVHAHAADVEYADSSHSTSEWWNADRTAGSAYEFISARRSRDQYSRLDAAMYKSISFPVTRLELSQSTGGRVIHSAAYQNLPADYSYDGSSYSNACVSRANGSELTWVFLCTNSFTGWDGQLFRYTSLSYMRWAGEVSYLSKGFSRYWYGSSDFTYTWNFSSSSSFGQLVPYGTDFSFNVVLDNGGDVYRTNPTFPLTTTERTNNYPMQCYGASSTWWGGYEYCYGSWSYSRQTTGSSTDWP